MAAILSLERLDRQQLLTSATNMGFEDFAIRKFIAINYDSDLTVYQLISQERATLLLYAWTIYRKYVREHLLNLKNGIALEEQEPIVDETILDALKVITYYSVDLLFAREFDVVPIIHREGLRACLRDNVVDIQHFLPLKVLNLHYIVYTLGSEPWAVTYLLNIEEKVQTQGVGAMKDIVEICEGKANLEDIMFLRQEGLVLILHRLIKKFDAGEIEFVKLLSMRMVAAWNHLYKETRKVTAASVVADSELAKSSILMVCHLFLICVYEQDDNYGFIIDNMLQNIRFYSKWHLQYDRESEYTHAQYIAMTFGHFNLKDKDIFENFVTTSCTRSHHSLFGIVSQAYSSYLLGNLIMEMNNLEDKEFKSNKSKYNYYMDLYIRERECSEKMLYHEINQQRAQKASQRKAIAVGNMTNFHDKICKGNRPSNLDNNLHLLMDKGKENVDLAEQEEAAGRQAKTTPSVRTTTTTANSCKPEVRYCDTIFEHVPNHLDVLKHAYNALAKTDYPGWRLAKIYLLVKIINLEFNEIEKWRHHVGQTIESMYDLDKNLAPFYADMAKLFGDKAYIEQEFWLSAFYLNPVKEYYLAIQRCGQRTHKRRQKLLSCPAAQLEADANGPTPNKRKRIAKDYAKYELLSTTADAHEISSMTDYKNPELDYLHIKDILHNLHLPGQLTDDILSIMCAPRNKSFAWAVDWNTLKIRCRELFKVNSVKRRMVRQTMADFVDDLKYLNIDYAKYKNRPQINYGTIEAGFENCINPEDLENDDDAYDDPDEPSLEYMSSESETDEEDDEEKKLKEEALKAICEAEFTTTRRTRARTAAVIAKYKEETVSQDRSSSPRDNSIRGTPAEMDENKCTLYTNNTPGFQPFPDIWDEANAAKLPRTHAAFLQPIGFQQLVAQYKAINKEKATLDRPHSTEGVEVRGIDGGGYCNENDADDDGAFDAGNRDYEELPSDTRSMDTYDAETSILTLTTTTTLEDWEGEKVENGQEMMEENDDTNESASAVVDMDVSEPEKINEKILMCNMKIMENSICNDESSIINQDKQQQRQHATSQRLMAAAPQEIEKGTNKMAIKAKDLTGDQVGVKVAQPSITKSATSTTAVRASGSNQSLALTTGTDTTSGTNDMPNNRPDIMSDGRVSFKSPHRHDDEADGGNVYTGQRTTSSVSTSTIAGQFHFLELNPDGRDKTTTNEPKDLGAIRATPKVGTNRGLSNTKQAPQANEAKIIDVMHNTENENDGRDAAEHAKAQAAHEHYEIPHKINGRATSLQPYGRNHHYDDDDEVPVNEIAEKKTEYERTLKEFARRGCKVRVKRLTKVDCLLIRQSRVMIRRLNAEEINGLTQSIVKYQFDREQALKPLPPSGTEERGRARSIAQPEYHHREARPSSRFVQSDLIVVNGHVKRRHSSAMPGDSSHSNAHANRSNTFVRISGNNPIVCSSTTNGRLHMRLRANPKPKIIIDGDEPTVAVTVGRRRAVFDVNADESFQRDNRYPVEFEMVAVEQF